MRMLPSHRRERLFPVVPTLITLGNAVCGFGSITFAAKLGPVVSEFNTLRLPAFLILFAMVFDLLDGFVARRANQTSDFGAQLDSLCDVISFGVAPAFLMLKFPHSIYHPRLLWMVAVLYLVCVALRLARFNVQTGEQQGHDSFEGLPSPAAAGVIAAFAIALPRLTELTDPLMSPRTQELANWLISATTLGVPLITVLLAFLMVSRIRYPHLANQLFRTRHQFPQLVQLIFGIMAVLLVHELAIPLLLCYFVLASPLRAALHRLLIWAPWKSTGPLP